MPKVKVLPVGRAPIQLQLDDNISVNKLQEVVLESCQMRQATLIYKGRTLSPQSDECVLFKENDTLVVSPIRQIRMRHGAQETAVDPDADITYQINDSTSPLIRWLYQFLHTKLHFPKIVLYWLFSIRPFNYIIFVVWMILSPVAAHYEIGPLYILGTIFVLIVTNLGIRREGESSAYSLFNEGVRRLPGQLNADQIDQQIRQGRM